MKKILLILAVLLAAAGAVSSPAGAQTSGLYNGVAFNSRGLPAGGVYWAVCESSATEGTSTTPCTPTAAIYSDAALTQPLSNNGSLTDPLKTDGLGNFWFYTTPGIYTVQFYGPRINLTFKTIQVSGTSAGAGCSSGCVATAPATSQTVTQPASTSFNVAGGKGENVNILNGMVKADQMSGSDWAAKINNCFAAAALSTGTQTMICDARGFVGTNTSSSGAITIPAGGVLLWGNGQLTISASPAVKLGGDGASLIGELEMGAGSVPRPQAGGFIACGTAGCTTVANPNASTANVDWVHIEKMALFANGASSKVIDLTSVGHARIEDNQLTLGTGGGSYGIYGDTSIGDKDSTNDIIQHNQINNESANDVCLRLAGIFNINVVEINSCYMNAADTGQEGFIYAKDSNGNYPNNSLLYGNDAEQGGSGVSFGTIGYDIQGAQDITISNNRCEKIYACFKFPADGSAVGIHWIDNYLSISNEIQVLPNEPQAAQYAIDNNGHNWLPSQHFGFNDLAGLNLLGNANFEGWKDSTDLFYWGGVSGTNINQAGSGIYSQQASASAPADATTQGTYNVVIGDNATAGLGINSQCIQVDATMEYTFAFRVAAASTGVKFRPAFRFYSDPNCTEADKITTASANARVLAPANYAGQSASLSPTGPNWQSTNASLTYNNGINCNCDVTGADWNVGAASTWTPTRNFAITFRVPNAYTNPATVTQSMRVMILENTAANPNQIYVDDVVLSQGAASQAINYKPLEDSGNRSFYGTLTLNGAMPLVAGTSALGATNEPFADLFLGTSGSDWFHFGTSRLTTNQLWTVEDLSGIIPPLQTTRSSAVNNDCVEIFKDANSNIGLADSGGGCANGGPTVVAFVTKTASYTLTTADGTVEATGTAASQSFTVPHALPGTGKNQIWELVNDSTQAWSVACDSGNINGTTSVSLAANSSALVTADGTNCWEFATGSGTGFANLTLSNLSGTSAVPISLIPSAVNTAALGTAPLPWKDLYLGITANEALHFNLANLTANRTWTIEDKDGTPMMTSDAASCGQMPAFTGGDVTSTGGTCTLNVAKLGGFALTMTAVPSGGFQYIHCTNPGGAGTVCNNGPSEQGGDTQTGASYTIAASDAGLIVTRCNNGAMTDTLPDPSTSGFGQYFQFVYSVPRGTGTPGCASTGGGTATLTRGSSASIYVDGVAYTSLLAPPGSWWYLWSPDGTNWFARGDTRPTLFGMPAAVDYSGQTAAVGSSGSPVTLFTTPSAPSGGAAYRVMAALSCDTSTSTATVSLTVNWTDPSGTAQSQTSSNAACTTLGSASYQSMEFNLNAEASSAVKFYTTVANSPTYSLHLALEGEW